MKTQHKVQLSQNRPTKHNNRQRFNVRMLSLFIAAGGFCLSAHAQQWVTWEVSAGGNGHIYRAVPGFLGLTWTLADQLAKGEGGYLATITSEQENNFVFNLVDAPQFWTEGGSGPALGGFQEDGAPEPAGGWGWVTGENWAYSNWFPGQPNNWPGGPPEDRLHFYSGLAGARTATWNDIGRNDQNLGGYVIEMVPIQLVISRDGSGGLFVSYTGAPDVTYRLQRAASLTGPWSDLATNTTPATGLIEFHETSPPFGQAFYRTAQP